VITSALTLTAAGAPPTGFAADGDGVVIAVVGSGVDYTHAHLGGPGTADAYAGNNPELVEPGSFPTAKVIGGYDFAGTRYSAACPDVPLPDMECHRRPRPDGDPLDGVDGVGTTMAGVAAGEAGGAGASVLPAGAAPGARLVALKVLGTPAGVPATSDLFDEAIDWVVRHNRGESVPGLAPPRGVRIDVVLVQAGPAWSGGGGDLSAAIAAAAAAGVTVVAPAGDEGGRPFAVPGPAASGQSLTVAAAFGDRVAAWGIRAAWMDGGQPMTSDIEAVEGGNWLPRLADVGPIEALLAWYGQACNDEAGGPSMPEQDVREKVALIERGTCVFTEKLTNAARMGAIAAVVYSDQRPRGAMPCGNPCNAAPGIPGVMIDNAPGLDLRRRLEAGTEVTVTLDAALVLPLPWRYHTLLSASGRGPDRVTGGLRPHVTAVGADVPGPRAGTGRALATASGTARAAANAAGLAARLHARSMSQGLGLGGSDVAALMMNSAVPDLFVDRRDTGPRAPVTRQGSGRLDAARALTATTLVRADGGLAELGLAGDVGLRVTSPEAQVTRTLAVRNLAAAGRRYRPAFTFAFGAEDAGRGIEVSFDPAVLAVPGRGEAPLRVAVTASAADLRPWTLDRGNAVSDTLAVQVLEIDGFVTLQEVDAAGSEVAGGDRVTVPLHALPRRASCVEAASLAPFALWHGGPAATQRWVNPCVEPGIVRPMVQVGEDPAESTTTPAFPPAIDLVSIGLRYGQAGPPDPAAPTAPTDPTLLEWHIRTRGTRRLPADAAIDVLLDTDRDGRFDRVLTTAYGAAARQPAGRWYTLNTPLRPGTLEPDLSRQLPDPLPVLYDLDASTTVLRASADDLLLDPLSGEEAFGFAVRARDGLGDYPLAVDFPGYDLAPDGLADGAMFTFEQSRFECLVLQDAGGRRLGGLGGDIVVPAGGEAAMSVSVGPDCVPPDGGWRPSLLLGYPMNATAERQGDVWRGNLYEGRPAFIHLPMTLKLWPLAADAR